MKMNILPLPTSVTELPGSLTLSPDASIAWQGPDSARDVAELLAEYLRPATGYALPVAPGNGERGTGNAVLLVQTSSPTPDPDGFLPEDYTLAVDPATGVRIEAGSAAGLARGIQTLRQLFPAAIYGSSKADADWTLPAVRIEDAPAFRWRGLHLDVCRHFFSVDDVCRYIELLAQHRMSVFHWHLTEDQGWRIEIKKYPRLTAVGSVRKKTLVGHHGKFPHVFDDTPYGGFYTQDDIRRVVAFAARRHIAIVPEIDMPGHMVAAIAAYPELGNGLVSKPEVRCFWGISQQVLNLNDATVRFCEDVWSEIFDLFPFRYCHLGGDEAPTHEWEESEAAQRLMAERGITTPRGMQTWFTAHMDAFFRAHGRRLIGWDEILEGPGVDASAAIMYWRPWSNIDIGKAAAEGHSIVVADNSVTYFDHYQSEPQSEEPLAIGGLCTLPHVYGFDPLARIPASAASRVLGGQGQLWTEYIATRDYLDYMAYPRACALAEVLWTPKARRNYACFAARLAAHRARLAVQGVAACPKP